MTYEIAFYDSENTEGTHFGLCSTGSWEEFRKWVKGLPEGEYPLMEDLCDKGEITDTEELRLQIDDALYFFPPGDGVRATAGLMLERIGDGKTNEQLVLEQ
jgi:hypothetical protein